MRARNDHARGRGQLLLEEGRWQRRGQGGGEVGQVEVHGDARQHGADVRVGGDDAGGVEQAGDGAVGDGDRRGVGGVAGVVLGAAAEGDVLQSEAEGRGWEGGGCWEGGC